MSYTEALAALPWDWILLGGALGGALNAASSSNLRLFPAWSLDRRGIGTSHVVRVGLLVSSAAGALGSAGVWAVGGMATLSIRGDDLPFRLLVASLLVGFVTARGLTSEVDKVLLRLAVRSAAAAPAVHPEIAEAIDHAPPYAVYKMAADLAPRRRHFPPGRIHVGSGFEEAHPHRL